MKNGTILDLEQLFLRSKYTTLKSDESYKVFQNTRRIISASKDIREAIQELIDKDEPLKNENGGIDLDNEQSKVFKEHYESLLNDETDVRIKCLHWEGFDALCKENGWATVDINAIAEILLFEDELNCDPDGKE